MAISIGTVTFNGLGENQITWSNRYTWQPVGQSTRYAIAGNIHRIENQRAGRPIILTAELPWCWLTSTTVQALDLLASSSGSFIFVFGSYTSNVIFDRANGPFQFTPVDPIETYFTGTISLLEV